MSIESGRAYQAGSSPDDSIPKYLSAAQQYLQSLRECLLPPPDLREAWDAFYVACDPLVRRTVAACRIAQADADDCIQEAWTEITVKLTRFEYDPTRGAFAAWLRIVVRRAACRHVRRGIRQSVGRIDQDLSSVGCPRILGPATTAQHEEHRESVRQTLYAFRARLDHRLPDPAAFDRRGPDVDRNRQTPGPNPWQRPRLAPPHRAKVPPIRHWEDLAAALEEATSGATALEAGFAMESMNYSLTDDYLTHLFSTMK